MIGTVYTVPPIPPDEEHTTWISAGGLVLGVEYRLLDEAELAANYEGAEMDEIQAALDGAAVQDNGVSLHVKAESDGHEYLRFDMFEQGPHYHYIEPSGEKQTIVEYDRVALGDMLPWAMNQLRTRLADMLGFAGGGDLLAGIDRDALNEGLKQADALARDAQAKLAAAGGSNGK